MIGSAAADRVSPYAVPAACLLVGSLLSGSLLYGL